MLRLIDDPDAARHGLYRGCKRCLMSEVCQEMSEESRCARSTSDATLTHRGTKRLMDQIFLNARDDRDIHEPDSCTSHF